MCPRIIPWKYFFSHLVQNNLDKLWLHPPLQNYDSSIDEPFTSNSPPRVQKIPSLIIVTMGFRINMLWSAPEINPYNKKATSIPVLNPVNKYGRVFFFSYMGFFIAFWSW